MYNQKYSVGTLLVLVCGLLTLSSCKKLIEIAPPTDTITASEVFSSKDQANSVIAGMYSLLMNNSGQPVFSNGGITRFAGMSSDELANFAGSAGVDDYIYFTNNLRPDQSLVNSQFWAPAYKIIYTANTVVQRLETTPNAVVDDSTKKLLTAEAKFIRAFCYFYLTNLYGDVPLVLTTDYTQTVKMGRTPQLEVYIQMEKDLREAKEALHTNYSTAGGERVRVNKYAAAAMLARVYLYEKKWAEAEAEATTVIGNAQYKLVDKLDSVFNRNSTETIFQLKQGTTAAPYEATWDGFNFIPGLQVSKLDAAEQQQFTDIDIFNLYSSFLIPVYHLTSNYVNAFERGDQRKARWMDSCATPAASPWNGVRYYFPYKYTAHSRRLTGTTPQYYMVLRLAEQYLIRAEARAQQGTNLSGAADDIDVLRTRADLLGTTASSKEELLDAVLHERQTELFAEWGHRWFDLKRTGKADEVLGVIDTKQPWSSDKLLYPIPNDEILNNPAIRQNHGY